MDVATLGIDLAKSVFQIHGVNKHGNPVLNKRLSRSDFIKFMANLLPGWLGLRYAGEPPLGVAPCVPLAMICG